jgi:FkbM family methyltransferase
VLLLQIKLPMAFVSYAQNYEDVILWRALGDVEGGFYVDVGAADPQEDSVTKAFYERGWSGINIEPVDEYFRKLAEARPRDTNLHAAAGAEAGLAILNIFPGTGLSTLDLATAERHQAAGRQPCQTLVPVLTLKAILEHCAPPTIHFLKIDVEGAEIDVLKGLDLNATRPWVIVVEGTAPNSQISTREEWESLILSYDYDFAYFDGLNCFYVAKEFSPLKEKLSVPPNFFDEFVRFTEVAVRQQAANLECEVAELRGHAAQTANLRNALHAEREQTTSLRNALHVVQEQTASLRNALHVVQEQSASLREALNAKQAQNTSLHGHNTNLQARLEHLSGRIHQLEVQLAAPSVDRAIGRAMRRAREVGDRITGGGLRSLVKRTLAGMVQRSMRDRRVLALGRTILSPFPRLTTGLYELAASTKDRPQPGASPPTPSPAVPQPSTPVAPVATSPALPASALSMYLRLKAAIAGSDSSNRIR